MVQENSLKKLAVIVGPTAVGKTALGIQLAKKINSQIISLDSMQIYKGMDIGTAKPSIQEQQAVKHHMIDIVEPDCNFSVADYVRMADDVIFDLYQKSILPIVVGGTGLYATSLLFQKNLGCSKENSVLRTDLTNKALEFGNEYVHNILKKLDEKSASEIHPNNLKRVIRAIEICILTNGKKSDLKQEQIKKYDYKLFAINLDREILYERIDTRVDIMINNGLVDEVKGLLNKGYGPNNNSMQAIGYKQVIEALNNKYTITEAIQLIKQGSRNYAKRQITWFKAMPEVIWLEASDKNNIDKILENID